MNPKSVKAKGRNLQNLVRDKLRLAFCETSRIPKLHQEDIKSQTMGMCGEDIVLSPKGREMIPYSFECKNVERLQFWATVEQAESNLYEKCVPAIVVKKNKKKPYVAIPLEHFIELIRR
mgnify:CR=1 FL=1